ncbi:MAG: alpha/beta hydrolase [Alphaproteobacteria bacterium]|nr:alpha/beta hydrolase [Alphaproteobacteria bacterium]
MIEAPWWLPGGHLQTIWANQLASDGQNQTPLWQRERVDTPDGDFIDIDHLTAKRPDAPLLVLFHGLEGSSRSHYARAMAAWAMRQDWSLAVPHFRGCSGELNRGPRAYHSGDHAEIDFIVRHTVGRHRQSGGRVTHAVGISLGGNALMLWAAVQGEQAAAWVGSVTSVCSPLDLTASGHAIGRGINRLIYTPYFLRTMLPKAEAKWRQHPGLFDLNALKQVQDLYQFDNLFTAPVHGFADTDDYWRRASAKPRLRDIRVQAYIVNALNDPFIPVDSLPRPEEVSSHCQLVYTAQGGHVSFVTGPWPPGRISLPDLLQAHLKL